MTNNSKSNNLFIENARVIFKNFSGKGGPYNDPGVRSFNVVIEDPELAFTLLNDGWNIRELSGNEDQGDCWRIPVAVSYRIFAPNVQKILGDVKIELDEESVGQLDHDYILSADVLIQPSYYTDREGNQKIKAYLRGIVAIVDVDPLTAKYANWGVMN